MKFDAILRINTHSIVILEIVKKKQRFISDL